ncbi:hypothetical protein DFH06DRAFT_1004635 [Mycena polygramma]|nr:hypothetical protein DFH06DRAFT_1004635 [Mycena polygramma]
MKACPVEGVPDWDLAVRTWTLLEAAYGFQSSAATLPATPGLRPSEVAQWIKHGRSITRPTEVEDHDMLVEKWWEWWSDVNPDWREKDGQGRPVIGEQSGDWGTLVHPGANGILTALLLLVWWREGETGAPTELWLAAVRDVGWVLTGLLSAARTTP